MLTSSMLGGGGGVGGGGLVKLVWGRAGAGDVLTARCI